MKSYPTRVLDLRALNTRLLVLAAGWCLAAVAQAASPLLTPQQLQAELAKPQAAAQLRVIDIRDAKSYAANHIPGALNAPYGQWRGPADNPGELPPLAKLTALVQGLGLSPATHAVVVSSGADATDFGASARVYWTLKVLGLKELSVLNGGLQAWSAAGLPQDAQPAKVAASNYAPQLDTSLIATKQEVLDHVKRGDALLVDARPADFFNGEKRAPAAKVPGTLQGAVNVQHDKWFAPGSAQLVSGEQAKQVAAQAHLDGDKETVSFCNTGHWAATNWFAMSEVLGQKNVKLYPGSMVEWSQDAQGLPMANVPGRAQQLLIDSKMWIDSKRN